MKSSSDSFEAWLLLGEVDLLACFVDVVAGQFFDDIEEEEDEAGAEEETEAGAQEDDEAGAQEDDGAVAEDDDGSGPEGEDGSSTDGEESFLTGDPDLVLFPPVFAVILGVVPFFE